MNYSSIKLIIWDLDDTFWDGTLSEGAVEKIQENIDLLFNLTDHGIINSICSKNDLVSAQTKLSEFGVQELFVFKSINWDPKGKRISKIIKDMGLRAINCLFVDDNPVNLNEALHYEPNLNVANPSVLKEIKEFLDNLPPNDKDHMRLERYHTLELKTMAKEAASDNLDFLLHSGTRVEIHEDCLNHVERIAELVSRTNQLNYTKKRSSLTDIEELCKSETVHTGYVTVSDKFGDYGIVGFFAIKNNRCLHFLFSCRTIGQGVEQYVYAKLGYPELDVVGEVVSYVNNGPAPIWINNNNDSDFAEIKKSHRKIVLKGGCDLKVMSEYLQTDNVIEEFTYTGLQRHNWIEHQNHSVNYLQWHFLSDRAKDELLKDCIFNDEEMFRTSLFDKDVAIIFLSTMIEPNLGVYRRKRDGFRIAFGEYLYPLTDPANWDLYVENKIFTAQNAFTYQWLRDFSSKYEFVGHLSVEEIIDNVKTLLQKVCQETKVCYLLGSEKPFFKNTQPNYKDRHLVYKDINYRLRQLSTDNDRLLLIDFNDYIRGQEDFTNNINHFQRRVYYSVATKANEYIGQTIGNKLTQRGKMYLEYMRFKDLIAKTGLFNTAFWRAVHRRSFKK